MTKPCEAINFNETDGGSNPSRVGLLDSNNVISSYNQRAISHNWSIYKFKELDRLNFQTSFSNFETDKVKATFNQDKNQFEHISYDLPNKTIRWSDVFNKKALDDLFNSNDTETFNKFQGLIDKFILLLDKDATKCHELKSQILETLGYEIDLRINSNFEVSKDSFKEIKDFLSQNTYKDKNNRSRYNDKAKLLSDLFNLYLQTQRINRLAIVYIKIFQIRESKFRRGVLKKLDLTYLSKAVRVLESFTETRNMQCNNCGHIENFTCSSNDFNEPVQRERRALKIKFYLKDVISYYRHHHNKALKFLTLSVKRIPTNQYSKDINKELKSLFTKFSKRKFFADQIDGYACVFEIKHYRVGDYQEYKDYKTKKLVRKKITEQNEGYHIHLHILILNDYNKILHINTDYQKKRGLKVNEKSTIAWNWADVCNKSKIPLFHGSYITNIKTPESIEYEQELRAGHKLSKNEKTDALVNYLVAYATKTDNAIKSNFDNFTLENLHEQFYRPSTKEDIENAETCPYIKYIESTENINFIQYGGILLKNRVKGLVYDIKKKKNKQEYTQKAQIPQEIDDLQQISKSLKEKGITKEGREHVTLKIKDLRFKERRIRSHFEKRYKYECPVCHFSDLVPHSVGLPIIQTEEEIRECYSNAIKSLLSRAKGVKP